MTEPVDPLKELRVDAMKDLGDHFETAFNLGYDDGFAEGRLADLERIRQGFLDALRKAGYRAFKDEPQDAIIARAAMRYFEDLA